MPSGVYTLINCIFLNERPSAYLKAKRRRSLLDREHLIEGEGVILKVFCNFVSAKCTKKEIILNLMRID